MKFDIKRIDGEKYYHDHNVAVLMLMSIFFGILIGWFIPVLFI